MKLFQWSTDGGKKSGVFGFFICEFKPLFSIVILKFNKGSRENYHSHAFNALTWFLSGELIEHDISGTTLNYIRSILPKITLKNKIHKVFAKKTSYAISIRGPWDKTWFEYNPKQKKYIKLSNGRKVEGIFDEVN